MTTTLAPVLSPPPAGGEVPDLRLPGEPTGWRRLLRPRTLAFLLLAAAYFVVGAMIMVRYGVIVGDALARVANANYVIASRDPHLSAIGFVWNPLPSLLTIPVLFLRSAWTPLAAYGAAGGVISSLFMAGAVLELDRTARELRTSVGVRRAVVVLFALNPMIVFYAGNGMSEAMFCYFLLYTSRQLSRWLTTREVAALAGTALGLAGGYLTRYEALPAALAVTALVAVFSWLRSEGFLRSRLRLLVADVAVVAMPFVAMFALWAMASWMIVGSPFEQFTSSYGNNTLVGLVRQQHGGSVVLDLVVRQLLALEPLAPVLLVAGAAVAFFRRDPRLLSPLAIFGSVIAFSAMASLAGSTFGFLRFYLSMIPLASVVVLMMFAPPPGDRRPHHANPLAAVCACLALAIALPTTALAFRSKETAVLETPLAAVFDADLRSDNPGIQEQFSTERQIASYLDSLGLPEGSVLLDVRLGFAIVVASDEPKTFVIPSDRDFEDHLTDPVGRGIQYMLVTPSAGAGSVDRLNMAYPDLYESGAGISVLAGEFSNLNPIDPPWRLYRVIERP